MSCKDFKIEPQANGKYRLVQSKFSGIFTGDLGERYNYDKTCKYPHCLTFTYTWFLVLLVFYLPI